MKTKPKAKKHDKQILVDSLSAKLGTATALYYTDFTGLNVKRMTELRRRLSRAGVEYVVIKNTLAIRAVNESGLVSQRLKGPTGVVVAKDAIAAAKVLADFAKENDQKPSVKGGIYEGKSVDEALVKKLATLPSREEALSIFAGYLNSIPMMFALALDARKTQLESSTDSPNAGSTESPAESPTEGSTDGSNELPQASA
jgi:large subunit ribosomal protein L10